ncbi:MetQ/NlpA family ABC transporter substrate-binding protein [Lactobacillus sp. Sy-1]|uniref:MetQ/NlpA family ABC transporter substrate-binding protein n=1 Tax=Lactobacillus sp. Sy-1 TaxID=2109645 RepID=UPI001C5862A5|nr:MetQ/NlpA family ABC transporter substrate-binding protein [Lactobacillus sp. Sy-1]MBW1604863.1 MetQ/NlpA family ABC transporter substrate-binding protein [Lactobacillus sp. Sy-1]
MKKLIKYLFLLGLLVAIPVTLAACGKSEKTVKIGIMGNDYRIWNPIKKTLKKEGINLQLVSFSDYSQPNGALQNHEIDANAFQHQAFLDNWNKAHKSSIVSIGNTVLTPIGLYSKKISSIKDLKKGDTISLPNDPTNEGRALQLLAYYGLIKVKDASGFPTTKDVYDNKLNLKFTPLDAAQTARSLDDVTAAIVNTNYALDAKLNPKKALIKEKVNEESKPYINIIATNKSDKNNKDLKKVVEAYQTSATAKNIEKTYDGAFIPAWNIKLK